MKFDGAQFNGLLFPAELKASSKWVPDKEIWERIFFQIYLSAAILTQCH